MGVIQRQSIKQGFVTYIGIFIGTISTLFVYPILGKEKFGEIQSVLGFGAFLVPFIGFGLPSVAIHFFPLFKDTKEKRGRFLFVLMRASLISIIISFSLIYFFRNIVSTLFAKNAHLLLDYLPYILTITFATVFITLLQFYISNFNRIVIPNVLFNLFLKIVQPILVIFFIYGMITFDQIILGLTLSFLIIVCTTLLYLRHLGYLEINTKKTNTDADVKKKIVDYSLFTVITTAGFSFAMQLDKILIPLMLGAGALGVFSIPVLITEAIDVIRKSISGIASPVISDSLKSNDLENVNTIYKKSAMLQFTIGMLLLIGASACADNLYAIMPNGSQFAEGKSIILILGAARIVDMLTGVNTEIIAFSNFYRANLLMLIVLAITNLIFNYLLIPIYGIHGAAFATLISMFFFNLFKLIFIYKKLGIHPFNDKMIIAFVIAIITFFISLFIPNLEFLRLGIKGSLVLSIMFKAVLISSFYMFFIWKFKISDDINQIIDSTMSKFTKR